MDGPMPRKLLPGRPAMNNSRRILGLALLALAVLYAGWFGHDRQWVALVVFALPPLWLLRTTLLGNLRSGFWAGVLALLWFSHGVMVAWTRPPERAFALGEAGLAVVIVLAASIPGLRARFGGRRKQP